MIQTLGYWLLLFACLGVLIVTAQFLDAYPLLCAIPTAAWLGVIGYGLLRKRRHV